MTPGQTQKILDCLSHGNQPPQSRLSEIEEPDLVIEHALESEGGRHWLRSLADLTGSLAEALITYEDDFRSSRRDRTLDNVVNLVSNETLARYQASIAQGSGAEAFWSRLSEDPDNLIGTARAIIGGPDAAAAESTLYLLVLDPIDQYSIGEAGRISIATTGLGSSTPAVRSLAAEYLFDHQPNALAAGYQALVRDTDERVRGLAWSAGIRSDTAAALELASQILEDDDEQIDVRRSALAALGANFETRDVIDLLADYVAHPHAALALDAANLLYRLHRHPTIAMAAAASMHQEVREIGEFLLDPYRGSPAAGGSRPGDPTHSDVFAQLIRETEERELETDDRGSGS